MKFRLARFSLGTLCLIASGLFAITLSSEFRFALQQDATLPATVAALPASIALAASDRSRTIALDNCYELLGSYYLRALPTAVRAASVSSCATVAEAIVHQTPTQGYGWLVLALASRQQGNADGFDAAMVRSHEASPNIGWLTQRRAMLLEDDFDRLSVAGRETQAADFLSMLQSNSGICTLARLHRDEPSARGRINAAVSEASERSAQAFLEEAGGQHTGRCSASGSSSQ